MPQWRLLKKQNVIHCNYLHHYWEAPSTWNYLLPSWLLAICRVGLRCVVQGRLKAFCCCAERRGTWKAVTQFSVTGNDFQTTGREKQNSFSQDGSMGGEDFEFVLINVTQHTNMEKQCYKTSQAITEGDHNSIYTLCHKEHLNHWDHRRPALSKAKIVLIYSIEPEACISLPKKYFPNQPIIFILSGFQVSNCLN